MSPGRTTGTAKLRLVLSAAAGALGLWIAWSWLHSDVRPLASWLVWPGVPIVVGGLGLRAAWKIQHTMAVGETSPVRPRQVLSFVALIFIAGSFTELVYFGFLDPLVPLIVFILAWTIQAEVTTRGPFTMAWQLARGRQLWTEQSPLRQWAAAGAAQARALTKRAAAIVQLDSPPRTTHHYYFVQLEDASGLPISEVYPLQTFAEAGGHCTRNLIRLVYVRER